MSDAVTTLREFTEMTEQSVSNGLAREALVRAADGSKELSVWAGGAAMDVLRKPLGAAVVGMLHDDMSDIVGKVWKDCIDLREAAKASRKSSEKSTVMLAEHEFSYEVQPVVDVIIAGKKAGSLTFVVKMLCNIQALALVLEKGAVTRIGTGACDGSAELSLAGQVLWKHEFFHADLPGVLHLKPFQIA
jgi:hypothetical protein